MKKKTIIEIIVFIAFSFILPLVCALLVKYVDIFKEGFLFYIVYGIEAMTPTIGGLLTLLIFEKNKFFAHLKEAYINDFNLKALFHSVLIPFVTFILTYILIFSFVGKSVFVFDITISKILIILWALIAEEFGWRYFLQGKLDTLLDKKFVPLIVGIIWSLWHYSFIIIDRFEAPIFLFIVGTILESYIHAELVREGRGNIVPSSVHHTLCNLLYNFFLIYPSDNNGSKIPYLLFVLAIFIVTLSLEKRKMSVIE